MHRKSSNQFVMRAILVFFLFLASFLFTPPTFAQRVQPDKQDTIALKSQLVKTGSAQVIEVITPNTIQLNNGTIIRLAGIHFPDYTPQEAGPFAVLALKILKDMLAGQKIDIYQTQNKQLGRQNRMGQEIAHLLRQEEQIWVQGALLSLGLAQVQTTQRNRDMAARMYGYEAQARNEKIGIWEGATILTPDEAQSHLGQFQIIEGRIESVSLNKNRLYINFGKNWRDDFTVSIAPKDQKLFSSAGLDPLQWGGEPVRVRGWLDEYNGPYIEVDHPEAIELLKSGPVPLQDQKKPPMMSTILPKP